MASDIERTCYWLARRPVHEIVPLEGRHEAEIAIVGAGLTGLWTALFLKELAPSLELVVLEREVAAHGASGRNAGILSETIDHSHGLAIQHFGEAEARRLARLGEQNVSELARFLVEREIDCDYEATGRLMVALTEAQLDEAHDGPSRPHTDSAWTPFACSTPTRSAPSSTPALSGRCIGERRRDPGSR